MMKKITLKTGFLHNREIVLIEFPFDREIIDRVRSIPGTRWSPSRRAWYKSLDEFNLHEFFEALKNNVFIDHSALKVREYGPGQPGNKKPEHPETALPPGYAEKLEQKRYSENTRKMYTHYFKDFQWYFSDRKLDDITREEINQYLLTLIREKNISSSQQNIRINAIKFYSYEDRGS